MLAEYFNVPCAKEYAREYLDLTNGQYSLEDLDEIASGQLQNINAIEGHLLITDTEMTVMKIWSEFKYGECSDYINQLWEDQEYDIYFLCDIDIPYESDPLREHEDFRDELYQIYRNVLDQKKANYIVVSGSMEDRLNKAIEAIEKLL